MGIVQSVFSQSFFIPAPPLTEKNIPDQSGRVVIVTGSNTGVGYELAQILYAANATVYIAARTQSKAETAISQIKSAHPTSTGTLHFLSLNLSDLTTISASAKTFLAAESRLDVIVNNAGVMVPPPNSKSSQGYELQFATNVLGPFMFTTLLLPLMATTAKTAPKNSVRVSWAGSLAIDAGSPKGGVTFDEDGSPSELKKDGSGAYPATKAANYFLAYEFGQRSGIRDGVLHNSFNPGNLNTELLRHARSSFGDMFVTIMFIWLLHKSVYGAYTELYASFSPDLTIEKNQGGYVVPWGRTVSVRADVAAECKEGGNSARLYEWCAREVGKFL